MTSDAVYVVWGHDPHPEGNREWLAGVYTDEASAMADSAKQQREDSAMWGRHETEYTVTRVTLNIIRGWRI